jgi:hypothetical protein
MRYLYLAVYCYSRTVREMLMLYFPLVASLSYTAFAQYFPPIPEGVTTLESKYHEGVKISYKEVGLLNCGVAQHR